MEYPKRPDSHIVESESWKLLLAKVPSNWILRQMTERDYGVDFYVEIPLDGQLTGKMFWGQLKGTRNPTIRRDGKATVSVKTSTVNYWMGFAVPLFSFIADVGEGQLYSCPAKAYGRTVYEELANQDEVVLPHEVLDFSISLGSDKFIKEFLKETLIDQFHRDLKDILVHCQQHWEYIRHNQDYDSFMGIEDEDLLHLGSFLYSLECAAFHLDIPWNFKNLDELIDADQLEWGKDSLLHNASMTKVLKDLEPIFIQILENLQTYVVKTTQPYWKETAIYLLNVALNLDSQIEKMKKQVNL